MSNEKEKTAVEWFIEQLEEKGDLRETPSIMNIQLNIDTTEYLDLKRQAKEMEKQRMIEFAELCWKNLLRSDVIMRPRDVYNETYGGDK